MTKWLLSSLAIISVLSGCASHTARADELALKRTFVLEGVRGTRPDAGVPGRLDHFAYDAKTNRLFATALENGSLEVIDLDSGKRIKSVAGLKLPQGIAIIPDSHFVVVACGGDGAMHVFDIRTFEEKQVIDVGPDADNVRYDPKANTIYVAFGDKDKAGIAVFDVETWKRLRNIPVASKPESFQLDPNSDMLYANVPNGTRSARAGIVDGFDRNTRELKQEFVIFGLSRNFPMALDAEHEHLFVAYRKPALLLEISAERNNLIAQCPCGEDSDDLFYDAKTNRVYLIAGGFRPDVPDTIPEGATPPSTTGAIEVYSVGEKGELAKIASVPTAPHARTGYFVPSLRALYVAVPMQNGKDPEILEYKLPE